METSLYNHLLKFIEIDRQEASEILQYFEKISPSKKEDLLSIGERCNSLFFVTKGCLYMYSFDENGTERTIQFAIENWWLTDVFAFNKQARSSFGIRAAVKSDVLEISSSKYQELLNQHTIMEKYFRTVNEIAYGAALKRINFLFTYSKEGIYHHFVNQFPEFANRVPQYLLASYLNLTPEYLSQIRRKTFS